MANVRTGQRAPGGAARRAAGGSARSRGERDTEPQPARRTSRRSREERRRKLQSELAAVACAALAALLFFVLYVGWNGGYVGSWLVTALRILVGLLAFLAPAAARLRGRRPRRRARRGGRRAVVTAGVVVLCAAFVLAAAADSFGLFGGERPAALFDAAYIKSHGGVTGEALWAATRPLLGGVGVAILVVARHGRRSAAGHRLVAGAVGVGTRAAAPRQRRARRAPRPGRSPNAARQTQERLQEQTALMARRPGGASAPAARAGATGAAGGRASAGEVSRTQLIDAAVDLPDLYEAPGMLSGPPIGHIEPPNPIQIPLDDEDPSSPPAPTRRARRRPSPAPTTPSPRPRSACGSCPTRSCCAAWATARASRARASSRSPPRSSRRWVTSASRRASSNTVSGPRVTRYELQLAPGIKVSRISSLKDDLAYALAATEIRVQAPIPGKQAVGVEVPNRNPNFVGLGDIYGAFPTNASPLAFWIGKDITGKPVLADLVRMVHVLIAGTTGSGKSGCINCIISSILLRATPDQVRMILVDPKKVELSHFDGVPHLLAPVVTNMKNADHVLQNLVHEMEHRYEFMMKTDNAQNLRELNRKLERHGEKPLPYIVLVIDELADLMMVAPTEVENAIITAGPARTRRRHAPRGRHAAAVGRRDHRPHQDQHPLAHRLRRLVADRLARDPRHRRRREPARRRRHALPPASAARACCACRAPSSRPRR